MTATRTNLYDALGLEILEPAERIEILNDLNDLIFKGTVVRLLERMDDKQKDEFDGLMASDADEEEVMAFLENKVPGAEEAVEDTVAELESDILAVTGS
jgi:non-homologous end joining protein Ku